MEKIKSGDMGSTLGQFWYRLFNDNAELANIATRATYGLLIGLSMGSMAYFNLAVWGISTLMLVALLPVVVLVVE